MKKIINGIVLFIVLVFISLVLVVISEKLLILLFPFYFVSICILVSGFGTIIKDLKTALFGEECYGILINKIQDKNDVIGEFIVYIRSIGVISIREVINNVVYLSTNGTFFKCKYYKDDINIIGITYQVSDEAKKMLLNDIGIIGPNEVFINNERYEKINSIDNDEEDGNIIFVDGEKYIKSNI